MPQLNARSLTNLAHVHPDLVAVVTYAATISPIGFTVIEGVRTIERQRQLLAAGATRTLRSRHLTGHAVDLACMVGGKIRWDWPLYTELSRIVKAAAKEKGVDIFWGGDWPNFRDGPHYELTWESYPIMTAGK